MKKFFKIMGLKVLFAVCVLTHVAAMMPHHHHDGSEVPCVALHMNHEDNGGDCCHSGCCSDGGKHHDHQDVPAVCQVHSITITPPERPQIEVAPAMVDLPDAYDSIVLLAEALRLADFSVEVSYREYRHGPDEEPLPLQRIMRASLSPRAPDFMA